jgi:DNA-binding NarL/FixJ family response regulator
MRVRELTDRQKHVAIMVAQGMSDREIAKIMKTSVSTVSSQLTTIYMKVGLKNKEDGNIRVRLANMVREGGLERGATV